jgi:hypothetical protein
MQAMVPNPDLKKDYTWLREFGGWEGPQFVFPGEPHFHPVLVVFWLMEIS